MGGAGCCRVGPGGRRALLGGVGPTAGACGRAGHSRGQCGAGPGGVWPKQCGAGPGGRRVLLGGARPGQGGAGRPVRAARRGRLEVGTRRWRGSAEAGGARLRKVGPMTGSCCEAGLGGRRVTEAWWGPVGVGRGVDRRSRSG
jgi:hypothetical protein